MEIPARRSAIFLTAALIYAVVMTMGNVGYASVDYAYLLNLTTGSEDARIDAGDLAFLLATHDFDATPKDGYVLLRLNGTVYKMTPNGERPGLADIVIEKE